MSICATNWAWSLKNVSPLEKLVLLSFADRAGETHEAWPSWSRLIEDTGITRKTLNKILISIQLKGHLIKTGEKKRQVFVYKLIGVPSREDKLSTTSSKMTTSGIITTSSKMTTSGSGNITTGTSGKMTTQNHKKNHQRNPKGETLSFSSFPDLFAYVFYRVELTGKKPVKELALEILFYADEFKNTRDVMESIEMAIPLVKSGRWKTPHGYKNITSKSIREKDEARAKIREQQIHDDAKIGRAINKAVKTGDRKSLADMVKEHSNANNGTVQKQAV